LGSTNAAIVVFKSFLEDVIVRHVALKFDREAQETKALTTLLRDESFESAQLVLIRIRDIVHIQV
jgi:hypothetical protein